MKAILWTKYGSADHLKLADIEKPTPKENEILVKIQAATVTPGDCEIRRFDIHVLFWLPLRLLMGVFKPKRPILGMEMAGEIEAIGKDVTNYKVGDAIVSGLGIRFGAHAEYVCIDEANIMTLKPENITYEQVASLPVAGLNALHYVRKMNIHAGQKILIIGAGGCFGTYGVQIAKFLGAEVTAVDRGDKLAVLKSIGADHVIDYSKEDFTKNGITYDAIFDVVGKRSIIRTMKSLKKSGRYVLANPWVLQTIQGLWSSLISSKKFIFEFEKDNTDDLNYLAKLMDEGHIKSVIDKRYKLHQMIEAHHYIESGDKIGNVVIKMSE